MFVPGFVVGVAHNGDQRQKSLPSWILHSDDEEETKWIPKIYSVSVADGKIVKKQIRKDGLRIGSFKWASESLAEKVTFEQKTWSK